MKFSENWLREFVNPDIDTNTLTHQLTMAGLEVDGFESAYSDISGVVVAEVKSVKKHPDADKLKVCQVDYGENDLLTIVCGADNVKQGMHTFLAKVGAKLPGIPTLEVATLKGIESHGMLCSPIELGLGDDSDGIVELSDDEPIGSLFNEIFKTDDKIIEISLTPNRGDCLSIKGIAQEVAVINQLTVTKNEITPVKVTSDNTRAVKLSADEACPRYVGRVIENVNVNVPSPLWLTEKLRCSGIRSINVIVDITNFVMLEMGQPMHAFDNDILRGEINIRTAKPGEKIKLLDESEHEIKPDTLLITDDSNALAMAGLMGGYGSAVNFDTKNVFLESAFFKPEVIIGEARQYGLHTDSSHRFERGVDPEIQAIAIERASGLILELCGGHAGPVVDIKSEKNLPINPEVILRKSQIKRVLGIELDEDFVTETFQKLNMNCKYNGNQWIIKPSSSRFDINIEVDLIEELTRIYGYDAIPVASPNHNLKIKPENKKQQIIDQIREILVNRDFQ
ncbi:MAG: phenylalanine--tRNA ligase subunit beta, partial [Proteobacteria bacterium]|nr:phenylalanine--tRNA ligase subunit beta [Pseudomonadota bacterium]